MSNFIMSRFLFLVLFIFLLTVPSSLAQSTISEDAVNFWNSWFGVPREYLNTPNNIILFVVAPIIISLIIVYQIIKELGFFQSGGVNFSLAFFIVLMMLPNGFFDWIGRLYSKTETMMALGLVFMTFFITGRLRSKIGSFGYSGAFSGIMAYAMDAVGMGIIFGGVAFVANGSVMGGMVYMWASIGAILGIVLIWWDKKGKRSVGQLDSLLNQEETITTEIAKLEVRLEELNKKAVAASDTARKTAYYNEMADIKRAIDRLRAQEEVVGEQVGSTA